MRTRTGYQTEAAARRVAARHFLIKWDALDEAIRHQAEADAAVAIECAEPYIAAAALRRSADALAAEHGEAAEALRQEAATWEAAADALISEEGAAGQVGRPSGPEEATVDNLEEQIDDALTGLSLEERVESINRLRAVIANHSPFRGEPVDFVRWVPNDTVQANDYNPNVVAPPEMELLRLSIQADGYTQPIVTMPAEDGEGATVIDGFHRNRVGKEYEDIRERVHGYLPIVSIRVDREDRSDRIASTIRHNRARGKHRIDAMSEIVVELKRRNWSNERVGKELGMDPDEVLRLCQMTGLSELFSDQEFSRAWSAAGEPTEADFVELREDDLR